MRKRYYILFVARDEQGRVRKIPLPLHYAYGFVAAAVIGAFTIAGLAGSYTRMLLKTENFNQMRAERETLRKNYKQMAQIAHDRDVQVASLGALANEVTALYGLRQSRLARHRAEVAKAASDPTPLSLSDDPNVKITLDKFYQLRNDAMSGSVTRALANGYSPSSGGDWMQFANAPSLWPVQGRIGSGFGEREDPIDGEGAFHPGVDIEAAYGTPVRATADGDVIAARMANGYGREVIIDHGHNVTTLYGHMSSLAVVPGEHVICGQVIGYVGQSGRATGPHLHYEVRVHNVPVNPHKYLRESFQELQASGSSTASAFGS